MVEVDFSNFLWKHLLASIPKSNCSLTDLWETWYERYENEAFSCYMVII